MSNHGPKMTPEQGRHFEKLCDDTAKGMALGATGHFPQGKIHPSDEGELSMAIGHKDGKVFVSFGTNLKWVAFDREQAVAFAKSILEHAESITGET
jgi:hypothetical protein